MPDQRRPANARARRQHPERRMRCQRGPERRMRYRRGPDRRGPDRRDTDRRWLDAMSRTQQADGEGAPPRGGAEPIPGEIGWTNPHGQTIVDVIEPPEQLN